VEFYFGMKEEFRSSGDWDGVAPFLDIAPDSLKPFLSESADVRHILQLAGRLLVKEIPATTITLASLHKSVLLGTTRSRH
jgi:hypothetical protein